MMTIAWQLLQWQLEYRLANDRSGGQIMYLAGARMMAAVLPVFLKTYLLCSYLSTSVIQFDSTITEVLDICDR
jgi:hypothetical protein